jgi:hypothetical protein
MHQAVAPGPGHSVAIAMPGSCQGAARSPPPRRAAPSAPAAKPGECLRSLEIDDQLKFVRKFDRQVTRLGTFEDLHDVGSRATKAISEIDATANYTASIDSRKL